VRRRSSLAKAGRILLALSAVVLLFVGYQLWGTGIVQARQQASLRSRFERSLGVQREGSATRAPRAAVTPDPPTTDPAVGQPVGTLVIPRIGLDQVVVEGTGPSQLAAGPGHYPGTPLPGQQGNAAIAGHRTTHGRPFYNLDALGSGDPITVTTLQGTFHYAVIHTEVVAPTDVAVLAPSSDPELTLTTCTPRYSAAQRLVVVARLVAPAEAAPAAARRPSAVTAADATVDPLHRVVNWLWLGVWGLVGAAVVALVVLARRRLGPRRAWLAPLVVAPVALVVLFFLFGAVNTLLPASF
jgi:sortase A